MDETNKPTGSGPWYVGFVVALGVSVDTSWRFFDERLGVTDVRERVLLFAVVEVMLLAAAWSMRAGVRRNGKPGSARLVAWGLCGVQAYMALELSGPAIGLARVVLGSGLALVALHQALGIEIKAKTGTSSGTAARIARELRERALSRLGLADDARDALTRTRQRAAVRAATIATSRKPSRAALRRAVLKSGAATDAGMRALLLDTRTALGAVDKLMDKVVDDPWTTPVPSVPPVRPGRRPSSSPTSGGPVPGWDVAKVVAMIREGRPADEIQAVAEVSAKNLQRVQRVMNKIRDGWEDEVIAVGDITMAFSARVREAMA
jgi:uncharacterized protein YerC